MKQLIIKCFVLHNKIIKMYCTPKNDFVKQQDHFKLNRKYCQICKNILDYIFYYFILDNTLTKSCF